MLQASRTYGVQTVKIILLGNGSIGKSSLIARFVDNGFARVYKQTIGLDFFEKQITLRQDASVLLQIWDIGGQSINSNMFSKYMYGVHIILFCYDVTDIHSFHQIEDWVQEAKSCLREFNENQTISNSTSYHGKKFYLIGNKIDLISQRVVTEAQHSVLVKQLDLNGGFFVSAQNGDNVMKTIVSIAAEAISIHLTDYELSFHEIVVHATISAKIKYNNEARTIGADAIEEEDKQFEMKKLKKNNKNHICSIINDGKDTNRH